jgi:hypothetical protein
VIRRRLRHALAWRLEAVTGRVEALGQSLDMLAGQIDALGQLARAMDERLAAIWAALDDLPDLRDNAVATRLAIEHRVQPLLRALVDEEAGNRRKLFAAREQPSHRLAYTQPDPLVSVVIATLGRPQLLTRALPSVLRQSHTNLEVLVVGDHLLPGIHGQVRALGDPRVRYRNLAQRLVAHPDRRLHWLVGSTMARNEAARLANGSWLVHFDDDDELHPDAIARLLARARSEGAEVCYGSYAYHDTQGGSVVRCPFPPEVERFAWPAAIIHSGLAFFERELVAAHLELPGDIYMLIRMLRAGVRFAMLDEVVLDYFPAARFGHGQATDGDPVLASLAHPGPVADRSQVEPI